MKAALRLLLFTAPFSVRRMFFMGEPGLHLEAITPEQNAVNPTMFQDSAGTTPITAIEQPVGKWICPYTGRFVSQASAGARPTYTRRVNLLNATATLSTQNVTTVAASYKLTCTGTGTVTLSGTSTAGPLVGTGANDRVSLTFTATAGTLTLTVSGSVTLADLRPSSIAALNIPIYQRVTSSTDYDTEGFPPMVKGNGTSQWMSGTLDMSSTDKVLVVAGVTKYSDAATAPVFELTANAAATNGAFNMLAPTNGGLARLGGSTRGSAMGTTTNCFIGNASPYGHAAPLPAVVALSFNNAAAAAADQASMRVNSGTPITGTTSDGVGPTTTGNYANSTIYLLSRGGASLFSSAGITSLTIRGGDGSAWVSRLENYVKNLMKLVY